MAKHLVRNAAYAVTLFALMTPAVYAAPVSTPPVSTNVTGGDPEPPSPHVIDMILTFLYLV
jgi:hypothetical protein